MRPEVDSKVLAADSFLSCLPFSVTISETEVALSDSGQCQQPALLIQGFDRGWPPLAPKRFPHCPAWFSLPGVSGSWGPRRDRVKSCFTGSQRPHEFLRFFSRASLWPWDPVDSKLVALRSSRTPCRPRRPQPREALAVSRTRSSAVRPELLGPCRALLSSAASHCVTPLRLRRPRHCLASQGLSHCHGCSILAV